MRQLDSAPRVPDPQSVGGALVQRPFRIGRRAVNRGERLTAAEVKAIPARNLAALIGERFILIGMVAGA